jgi:hypothetical protein
MAKAIEELARKTCVHTNFAKFMSTFNEEDDAVSQYWLIPAQKLPSDTQFTNNNEPVQQSKFISVMTMSASKGLEFDEVILPFWIDGNVPFQNTSHERRLAFVSLTRARQKVMISFSRFSSRGLKSMSEVRPSIYIEEIVDKRENLQGILFEDLSEDTRTADQIVIDYEKSRRNDLPNQTNASDINTDYDTVLDSEEGVQLRPITSKDLFGDSFDIKKTLIKSTGGALSSTKARSEKAASFIPTSPLTKKDVKMLLDNEGLKTSVLKKLFSDEIRRIFSCKRASIKVLENGVLISKALSTCNVKQLGQYLLNNLD